MMNGMFSRQSNSMLKPYGLCVGGRHVAIDMYALRASQWGIQFARRAFMSIAKRHLKIFLPVGHQYDGLKPCGLCLSLSPLLLFRLLS